MEANHEILLSVCNSLLDSKENPQYASVLYSDLKAVNMRINRVMVGFIACFKAKDNSIKHFTVYI